MTIDTDDLYNSIIESFGKMTYIKASEIPGIDLYMDQVTTFIDERLRSTARDKFEDEKLMTKTMINNYAKNDVIPPPVRKKYNKEHVLLLIIVYYFKSMLQISDIKELLEPIVNDMFGRDCPFNIEDVYREIFSTKGTEIEEIKADVLKKYETAMQSLKSAADDFDVADCFEILKKVSQTVCPTVVSMVYDVTERVVCWCENQMWSDIKTQDWKQDLNKE